MSIRTFLAFQRLIESGELVNGVGKINNLTVLSPEEFLNQELGEETAPLDEYSPLLGVTPKPIDPKDMQDFLHRSKTYSKNPGDKYQYPYIHPSSITYVDQHNRVYDTEKLKALIKQRPKELLRQNTKLQHSGGDYESMFNIGIPAVTALSVNEQTDELIIVKTCPGAGKCLKVCYAMKGGYVQFEDTWIALSRTLNFLLNDPDGFIKQMGEELIKAQGVAQKFDIGLKKAGTFVTPTRIVIRWHDAGDFFSPEYLEVAYEIARQFPTIEFYAYTKIAAAALGNKPPNFLTRFSMEALPGQAKLMNFKKNEYAEIVPRKLFYDLIARDGRKLVKDKQGRQQFASPEAEETFRTRMSQQYDIPFERILSYDEIMAKPKGTEPQWYVFIKGGDGDDAADRRDVLGVYNLEH